MRLVLALAFLLCSSRDAAALQKASAQDQQDIANYLGVIVAAEDGIRRGKNELNAAKGNEAEERRIELEIARDKKMRKDAHEQAMWLTLRAYDIIPFVDNEPILPSGDSVLRSPEKGTRITWVPVFDEIGVKPRQNEFGRPAGTKNFLPINAGNTASDGVSRMFPGAFESPVQLASYLIHEVRHFWQNTTPGKGDDKTTAELEVEAYGEELRLLTDPKNPLGYSEEIKKAQLKRLTLLLNGDEKNVGFINKALKERAEANRLRGGRPLPELSLVSHSKVEIDELIQQAKDQIVIVQRDHDDRLRNTVKDLAWRSCANAGSVSQAELAALAKPHRADYWRTGGPENCHGVYAYMAQGGTDAEELRRISTPPPVIQPTPPSQPAQPIQSFQPQFSTIFPKLKEYAFAACRDLNQAPAIYPLYRKYSVDVTGYEDTLARNLTAGLDNCSRQLFYKMIDKTRADNGRFHLTYEWVRAVVAANKPGPETAPGNGNPPAGGAPPGGGGGGCERNGDPFGCQPKHPHKLIPKSRSRAIQSDRPVPPEGELRRELFTPRPSPS